MKKTIIVISFLILQCNLIIAQEEFDYDYPEIPTHITPPSFNASSLGKYVEVPVDYYTGVPKIEIPIYEIQDGDLKLPISLSYHASGHKVAETPSWAGLGWTLNAGGAITRVVNGNCDFMTNCGMSTWEEGYLFSTYEIDVAKNSDEPNHSVPSELVWNDLVAGRNDGEPDMFYFNFAGMTGKFAFDKWGNVKQFAKSKLKIQAHWGSSPAIPYYCADDDYINKFTATTEDGTIYTFDKVEYQKIKTRKRIKWDGDDNISIPIDSAERVPDATGRWEKMPNKAYVTAWYLTKIQSPKGDYITLIYTNENYLDYKNGTFAYFQSELSNGNAIAYCNYIDYHSHRLSSISWSGGFVFFNAEHERKDLGLVLDATEGAKALTSITISNGLETVKQIDLTHSYMKRDPLDNHYLDQRLQLDKVEISKDEGSSKKKYQFEYEGALASKRSYNVDYWGYCNFNNASSFKSNLYTYGSTSQLFPFEYSILSKHGNLNPIGQMTDGFNRSPNFNHTKRGMLKKIQYPTGGYAEFEYEPHQFHIDGNNYTGGGVRIKTIKSTAGFNSSPTFKKYTYTIGDSDVSSGRIINIPILGNKKLNCGVDAEIYGDPVRYSNSVSDLTGTKSSFVGYTEVKEELISDEQATDNIGSITRKYSLPASYGVVHEDYIDGEYLYNKTETHIFAQNETLNPSIQNVYTNDELSVLDPAPNPNYDWNRGMIQSELIKDKYDNPLKEIEFLYNDIDTWLCPSPDQNIFCVRTKLHSLSAGYIFTYSKYYLTTGWRYLKEKKVKTYDPENSNNFLTETTQFYYDNIDHMQKTKVVKANSDGSIHSIEYEYPADYPSGTGTSTEVLQGMVSSHIHSPIIRTKEFNGTTQIGGKVINYLQKNVDGNTFYAPFFICNYEDGNYISNLTFDEYGEYGRLLEYHKSYSNRNAIQWGYNSQYMEAQAKNSRSSEFHYWSYENVRGGTITSDKHTGRQCARLYSNDYAAVRDFEVSKLYGDKYIYSGWFKTSGEAKLIVKDKNDQEPWKHKTVSNTNGKWQYYELEVDISESGFNGCTDIRCEILNTGTADVLLDDVIFRPKDAQVTTCTYDQLIGMTSTIDPSNDTKHFEYDDLNRLEAIKDEDGNILESYDYNNWFSNVDLSYEAIATRKIRFTLEGLGCNHQSFIYSWDFGDGNTIPQSSACELEHEYSSNGTYTVKVDVHRNGEFFTTLQKDITFSSIVKRKKYKFTYSTRGNYCTHLDEYDQCRQDKEMEGLLNVNYRFSNGSTGANLDEYVGASVASSSSNSSIEEQLASGISQTFYGGSIQGFPNLFIDYDGVYLILERDDSNIKTDLSGYNMSMTGFSESPNFTYQYVITNPNVNFTLVSTEYETIIE